jgi:hypothetical protein
MRFYNVRYVHKVAPKDTDTGPSVLLSGNVFADRKTLAKALRQTGVIASEARIREYRVEGNKVVIFPTVPGMTTYWHSVIMTAWDADFQLSDLDDLDNDSLMTFWKRYHRASRKDALELVGARPGFTNVAAKLANYACNLAVAMTCRAKGDEQGAEIYDYSVWLCYDGLPTDLQWKGPQARPICPPPKPAKEA